MYEPSCSGVTVAGSSSATRPPHSMTISVSRQPDELLEVGGDRAARPSPSARAVRMCVPDGGLGADVDTSGRVRGDEHLRVAGSSPGRRRASAGCRRTARRPATSRSGCATSNVRDDRVAVSARAPAAVDRAARATSVARSGGRAAVLPQRGVEQQALAVAVLGDVADAGLTAAAGRPAGHVVAAEQDRVRSRRSHARGSPRPARPGRCPRRRRCRRPRRGGWRRSTSSTTGRAPARATAVSPSTASWTARR